MRGDNIGVHVESTTGTVTNVLVCLDITEDVVREAVEHSCDTIVAFHPLIYTPVTSLRRNDRVGRLLCDLIARNITCMCVHTAYDAFPQGTNALLASRLGLSPIRPLEPVTDAPGYGMGLLARAVGGSGASFTDAAIAGGADVFITADLKYHAFLAARSVIGLIDPGHYEMEQFVIGGIAEEIERLAGSDVRLHRSTVITNPVLYASPTREQHSHP
jgi:putative NIF3 family GTP cyclohydrolase 1 type 2